MDVAGLWLVHINCLCSHSHDKGVRIGERRGKGKDCPQAKKKKKRRHRVSGICSYGYGFFSYPCLLVALAMVMYGDIRNRVSSAI